MPNNNNLINLVNNKKSIELVQELKDYEIKTSPLSKAARNKVINKSGSGYVSEGKDDYGPCNNSSCDCSCSRSGCSCRMFSVEGYSGKGGCERYGICKVSSKGKIGLDGVRTTINSSLSAVATSSGSEEASFFGVSAENTFALDKNGLNAKSNLGLDLYNFKDEDKQIRIRPNIDTGISTEDGSLEVKAGGVGISVGKYVGISTPLGDAKFNTDNCVIQ